MNAESPKKADFARFFNISLTTFSNWRRQGCPDSSFPAAAAWRTRRDLQAAGMDPAPTGRLEAIQVEHFRRWFQLEERIEELNAIPGDVDARGHFGPQSVLKVSGLVIAALEREMLDLPMRLLQGCADPRDLPLALYEIVFEALDRVRGAGDEDSPNDEDSPSPLPAGHRARKAGKAAEDIR